MNSPKTRNENIVVQEMGKEILIYDLKTNKAFCLNETSALIWQLCDGTRTVAEISEKLSKQSNQPITEDLIWLALDNFKKDNLLENTEQFEIDFNGLTRRQVIKKVGLASLVMLPIISSIVAPVSAATASLAPLLARCTSSSNCQSGFCSPTSNSCCVPGTLGLIASNFCCSNPADCDSKCCTGSGTLIDPGACPVIGLPLRVACP